MAKRSTPKQKAAAQKAPRRRAAKRPAADDFDVVVQVGKRTVSVLFRPTNSHYLFRVVAGRDTKPRAGTNPAPNLEFHAGAPGAAVGYVESEVLAMSEQLASAAVKDVLV
jgi:hypothetical protein